MTINWQKSHESHLLGRVKQEQWQIHVSEQAKPKHAAINSEYLLHFKTSILDNHLPYFSLRISVYARFQLRLLVFIAFILIYWLNA